MSQMASFQKLKYFLMKLKLEIDKQLTYRYLNMLDFFLFVERHYFLYDYYFVMFYFILLNFLTFFALKVSS